MRQRLDSPVAPADMRELVEQNGMESVARPVGRGLRQQDDRTEQPLGDRTDFPFRETQFALATGRGNFGQSLRWQGKETAAAPKRGEAERGDGKARRGRAHAQDPERA